MKSVDRYFKDNNFELDFSISVEENLDFLRAFKDVNDYDKYILILTSVNNETGGIWNKELVDKIKQILKDKEVILFLDHTQGFMKHNQGIENADAFCFSAHKIGGMKGFGGLVYKKEIESVLKENPLIVGGYEIRGGTKDPISVKALANLVKNKYTNYNSNNIIINNLYTYIIDKLREIAKEYHVTLTFNYYSELFGDQSPYIINASFVGIEGESLMSSLMDDCISTGSACNSSELKTSHVLSGLGIKKLYANCAFRISLSEEVDKNELEDFLDNRFKPAIKFLSRMRTRHGEE